LAVLHREYRILPFTLAGSLNCSTNLIFYTDDQQCFYFFVFIHFHGNAPANQQLRYFAFVLSTPATF